MRVLTLGAMVEPAGHPTPNRVYPFRHRIAAYTKANVTDIWEREADLRFPTLTDLYVIESGNAACSVTGDALAINDTFRANFLRFKELRDKYHPDMRLSIVIAGSPEKSEAVRKAMGANRAAFVQSCIQAMHDLGADGMDVDFEYCVTDQQHRDFAGFMGALKDAFMAKGKGWELSMAVTPYHNLPKNAALATVDSINVMAYDGPLNAPYSRMSNFFQNLHSLGVPDRRIVMGQAIYGGYGIQPGWNSIVDLSDYTGYDCDVATRNGTRHTFTGPTTYRGKVRQCLEWDLGGIMSWGYYSDVNWNNLQSLGRHQAQVIRPRTAWDWPEPPLVDGVRELSTEGHWHWFADHAQTVAHARLIADITLTQDPRPIPTFSGTLDGGGHTLTLPAGLSDKLPAPEPGVTVLRFATDDDADRARFFDGLDISSTFEDNGATQVLATAETDFNVSAMGFDADGLWVEASLSHGTFNAATSLQAIPVTLGGTAARAAPIRTLAEEAPERNVRRLRLDLAQSGTHLFRLRPTLTP